MFLECKYYKKKQKESDYIILSSSILVPYCTGGNVIPVYAEKSTLNFGNVKLID